MTRTIDGPDLCYDEQTQVYRFRYTGERSFVVELVLAVATVKDEDPMDLDPLYDHVEPDVLEQLATEQGSFTGDVLFEYSDVRIRIESNGGVFIRPDSATDSTSGPSS